MQTDSTEPQRRLRTSPRERIFVWLLAATFPLAVLPTATVHAGPRAALAVALALLGAAAIHEGLTRQRPARVTALLATLGGGALIAGLLDLIPLGADARAADVGGGASLVVLPGMPCSLLRQLTRAGGKA